MTQIVFTCSSSDYATDLKSSIKSGATVTASGSTVTAELTEPSTSFVISSLSGQVRMNSLEVTYNKTTTGGTTITYSDYTTQCTTETVLSLRPQPAYRHSVKNLLFCKFHHINMSKITLLVYAFACKQLTNIVSNGQPNDQCPKGK